MFDLVNWRNPETLMLNLTNSALGIATVALVLWISVEAIHEYWVQHRESKITH
jgi:hypothetical protein